MASSDKTEQSTGKSGTFTGIKESTSGFHSDVRLEDPKMSDEGKMSCGEESSVSTGSNGSAASDDTCEIMDPNAVEEIFRVDRKKLERMLFPSNTGDGPFESGQVFFERIMDETSTMIRWPSGLKIGAKSKKDPHIKVTGRPENVAAAKEKIMAVLDTKSNRVTLKMDVSYTEHSHIIGKGGNNIRQVMQETGCHIHFPDSNRGTQQEKSNQVSIAGQIRGVEQARAKIRELLPLVLFFELPITASGAPDTDCAMVQQLVQCYNVKINMKLKERGYSTTVTVRGASNNTVGVKESCLRLMENLAGTNSLPVSTRMEIAPQHHQFMMQRGSFNIKQIMQCTGATIHFPDLSITQRKSSVFVSGSIEAVIEARRLLMGCLPLVLMFDMKEDTDVDASRLSMLMEKLDVFISIKPKPKQPTKSVIVKSIECNASKLYRARQILLGQECENCSVSSSTTHVNGTTASGLQSLGMNSQNGVRFDAGNVVALNRLNLMTAVHSANQASVQQSHNPPQLTAAQAAGLHPVLHPVVIPQQIGPIILSQSSFAANSNSGGGTRQITVPKTVHVSSMPTIHGILVTTNANQSVVLSSDSASSHNQRVYSPKSNMQQLQAVVPLTNGTAQHVHAPLTQSPRTEIEHSGSNTPTIQSVMMSHSNAQTVQMQSFISPQREGSPQHVVPSHSVMVTNGMSEFGNGILPHMTLSSQRVASHHVPSQVVVPSDMMSPSHINGSPPMMASPPMTSSPPITIATTNTMPLMGIKPQITFSQHIQPSTTFQMRTSNIQNSSCPVALPQSVPTMAVPSLQESPLPVMSPLQTPSNSHRTDSSGAVPHQVMHLDRSPPAEGMFLHSSVQPFTQATYNGTHGTYQMPEHGTHVLSPVQEGRNMSPLPSPPIHPLYMSSSSSYISSPPSTISRSNQMTTCPVPSQHLPAHSSPDHQYAAHKSLTSPTFSQSFAAVQYQTRTSSSSSVNQKNTHTVQSSSGSKQEAHYSYSENKSAGPHPPTTKSNFQTTTRVAFTPPHQSVPSDQPLKVAEKDVPAPNTATMRKSSSSSLENEKQTCPRPPPGFTKADPGKVSSELAELQLTDRKFGSSIRNRAAGQHLSKYDSDSSTLSKSQDLSRQSMENGNFSPQSTMNIQPHSSKISSQFSPGHSGHFSTNHNGQYSPSRSGHFSTCSFSPNSSGHFVTRKNGYSRSLTTQGTLAQLLSGERGVTINGMSMASSESEADSDSSDKRAPGWERKERKRETEGMEHLQQHLDYDQKKLLASKFMKKLPISKEVRTPTDTWSGLGFSKSMPGSAMRNLILQNGGLEEHDQDEVPPLYYNNNNKENSVKRKRNISTLSNSSYIDSSTLPQPSKALWSQEDLAASLSAKMDLSELLVSLGLSKYIDVFQQQEIDHVTFSTLTDNDLKELGISTFGARRKMLLAISDLNKRRSEPFSQRSTSPSSSLYFADQISERSVGLERTTPAVCW